MNVATNGLIRIPYEEFENMPVGIAICGQSQNRFIAAWKREEEFFSIALKNYKNDPRAFWYYTVAPGCADEIEDVVNQCIRNGNKILFNYYSDIGNHGGALDFRKGFDKVREEIDRMIDRYPDEILTTSYFNKVITTGKLYDQRWGYKVCTNVSINNETNQHRLQNGNPYNKHFRAYNADFRSTCRCCTGISRSCDSCFDAWEHFSWIMINMKKHMGSRQEFVNWLTSM